MPGFGDTVRADYHSGTLQLFGELGYRFDLEDAKIEPHAGIAHVRARSGGFEETGGPAKLSGAGADTNVTFSTLGLRGATGFDLGKARATVRVGAGWRHALTDAVPITAMRYQAGGGMFLIAGLPVTRDAATLDAGLDLAVSGRVSIGLAYTGQRGGGLSDQGARGSIRIEF